MEKNKAKNKLSKIYFKHSKIHSKVAKTNCGPFLTIFLTTFFTFVFMLTLLPGCGQIFPSAAAHTGKSIGADNVTGTITSNVISAVWQKSVISMNNTLKQSAACSWDQYTGFKADKKISGVSVKDFSESNLSVLALINKYGTDPYGLILPENSIDTICSTALFSFYSNITEQLKTYKSKTGQSGSESQNIAESAGENAGQQKSSEVQTESQGSYSQEQSSQQEQDGQTGQQQVGESQTTEQLTTPPDQAVDFAAVLLSLINNARNCNGVPSLSLSATLDSIAKDRCDDMIARDYFSHIDPDGKDIQSLIVENGIMYKATGENLQYCFPSSMAGPELFFNSWMESETHRANILDPVYTQIGIALSFSADKAIAALVFLG